MELDNGIVVQPQAGIPERFAAAELGRYLGRMLGKRIPVRDSGRQIPNAIHIRAARRAAPVRVPVTAVDEEYVIDVRRDRVLLGGGSPRAALYAVYAFLEELGCRWFAPGLDVYAGVTTELVPTLSDFGPCRGRRVRRPGFLQRAVMIEECRTQTVERAKALIDWLAKVRMNVLHAPINYQHSGRFMWDDVRDALAPELQKRGLIVKVGGHGYENFMPPEDFFDAHPDWFAWIDGARSRNPHHVFETSNRQALRTFCRRVAEFLEQRPEIHILDLCPPDIVRWSEDPKSLALGTPARRQALVEHAVQRELRRRKLPVAVATIRYDASEEYPEDLRYDPEITATVVLFYQNHTGPVFDPASHGPGHSLAPVQDWAAKHAGPLSYLAYERRYVWQSRPANLPTLLWTDMHYCRDLGYSGWDILAVEPGDWLTFELQHYLNAKLAGDAAAVDVAELVADYCRARFGEAAALLERYFWLMQDVAVQALPLGFGTEFNLDKLAIGRDLLGQCRKLLRRATAVADLEPDRREHLRRLEVSRKHAEYGIEICAAAAAGDRGKLLAVVDRDLRLVRRHRDRALFAESGWLAREMYLWLFGESVFSAPEIKRFKDAALRGLLGDAVP